MPERPLLTVVIACLINIAGDLLLVAGFHMGAAGAATATVLAQAVSVIISMAMICRRTLPFAFQRGDIHFDRQLIGKELKLGIPVGLQEFLVGASFLFCFIGYFNGREKTLFVMLQGLIGAFGVRIPIVWLVSRHPGCHTVSDRPWHPGLQPGAGNTVPWDVFLDAQEEEHRYAVINP